MILATLTILGAALLAFANGANDVSRGVATLSGSGRASYRSAIAWGTLWTGAGALASLVIAAGLVKTFTTAIVGPEVLALPVFPLAAATGAAAWVVFATATGLPVSTTHALTGAIVGVAFTVGGTSAIGWGMVVSAIAAPLALSPLVSAAIGYGTQAVARALSPACVCLESGDAFANAGVQPDGSVTALTFGAVVPRLVARRSGCAAHGARRRFMPAAGLHWGAAAALSFARGVNDNAKIAAIAALGFTALHVELWPAFLVSAAAMTAGSYFGGLRVTRTLSERVVTMDRDTGLAAAVVSAGLVLAASAYAMPVSTTHVSTGAIVGAGLRQDPGAVHWGWVGGLASAWVVTLPVSAGLGALAVWTLGVVA
ncbi:MAG: inorganic phosphate transporter [Acidobacteria bacterium]|nr:inorganic phosphate transporter [Acidobacteriota bacterium]